MRPAYLDAVHLQPENLIRSRAVVAPVLDELRLGEPVIALGMGASGHAAVGFAAAHPPAVALSAALRPPSFAGTYLAISFSGRSRETVEAMATVSGAARIALTNEPASPIADVADVVLPLGCPQDSHVSMLSYTATLQALGLLADRRAAVWDAVPDAVAAALALDVGTAVETLADVDSVDVIGSGVHLASAGAAGLLLREAAHRPTAAYPTREYLHGALETAGPGRGALVFGTGPEVQLAADLAGYGSSVVLVTPSDDVPARPRLCVIRVPELPGLAGCVTEIVPVQLIAAGLADQAGDEIALRYMPDDTKL